MAENRKKRKRRFGSVMLLYALAVIALLLAALRPLWNYLAAYEDSSPNKAMDRYLESLTPARIRGLSADFVGGLDRKLQSEEQAYAAVLESMEDAGYALKSADADLRHATYAIRCGGREVGSVSLGKQADPPYGFSPWQVEREEYRFDWLLGEDEITVPDSYTVRCNGVELDESYRTGEGRDFACLADFYGDSRFVLPHFVTYRVEKIVGKAPFEVLDENGQPVDPAVERPEYELLANCDAAQQEAITALLDGFLQRYIDCLSNASRNVTANYEALKPYILAGSDIDQRVKDNMAGQAWAHSRGDTVEARTDKLLMDLGGGYYLADISYTLDTVGGRGHVKSVNDARLILYASDVGLRVIEIYSY